jgi:hypothetical protein
MLLWIGIDNPQHLAGSPTLELRPLRFTECLIPSAVGYSRHRECKSTWVDRGAFFVTNPGDLSAACKQCPFCVNLTTVCRAAAADCAFRVIGGRDKGVCRY